MKKMKTMRNHDDDQGSEEYDGGAEEEKMGERPRSSREGGARVNEGERGGSTRRSKGRRGRRRGTRRSNLLRPLRRPLRLGAQTARASACDRAGGRGLTARFRPQHGLQAITTPGKGGCARRTHTGGLCAILAGRGSSCPRRRTPVRTKG